MTLQVNQVECDITCFQALLADESKSTCQQVTVVKP